MMKCCAYYMWYILVNLILYTIDGNKDIPQHIFKKVKNAKNLDTFMEMFNMDRSRPIMSLGRNFDNPVRLENECCKPRPVIVEVPQPHDPRSFYYPFFITMYKCSGSCCERDPFGTVCEAEVREQVHLQVPDISWDQNHVENRPRFAHLPFYNETSCTCRCKHDARVCNRFQVWDPKECKCKCQRCPSEHFEYHPTECCVCRKEKRCARKHKWDKEKCACVCKKKRKCKNPLKERNPRTCRCQCNINSSCRSGVRDPSSCECKGRIWYG